MISDAAKGRLTRLFRAQLRDGVRQADPDRHAPRAAAALRGRPGWRATALHLRLLFFDAEIYSSECPRSWASQIVGRLTHCPENGGGDKQARSERLGVGDDPAPAPKQAARSAACR